MNEHKNINEMLTGFALGELSEQQISQVQKHLAECNLCSTELKRLKSLLEYTEQVNKITVEKQTYQAAESEILKTIENKNTTTTPKPETWQENIWRNIMKNRISKYAAVIIIAFVGLGLIPFHETTVLGQIIQNTTNKLARLKAIVLNEDDTPVETYFIQNPIDKSVTIFTKSSEDSNFETSSNENYIEHQIDKSVKISTNSSEYSSFEISSLESFLNYQNIYFSQIQYSNIKYAAIPYDRINNLQAFLNQNGYKHLSSPRVTAYAGQEAMIAVIGHAGLALTAFQDENNILNLDVAFHNGQDGFEINQIKLNNEAILVTGLIANSNTNEGKYTTILIQPEVE